MSLILTSSQQTQYNNNTLGIENPYSYQNYFNNPLIVPPNSSIAVQSIKFNREHTWTIMDGFNRYGYLTIGTPFVTGSPDLGITNDQQWLPTPFEIAPGNYTQTTMGSAIRNALNLALQQHPDIDTSGTTVVQKIDGDGNFDGYTITFKQKAVPVDAKPTTFSYPTSHLGSTDTAHHGEVLYNAGTFTMTAANRVSDPITSSSLRSSAMFTQYPISHMDGTLTFNVSGARTDSVAGNIPFWAIGLRRPCRTASDRNTAALNNINSGNMLETEPLNYRRITGSANTGPGVGSGLNFMLKGCRGLYDYVIYVNSTVGTADYGKIKIASCMTGSEDQSLMPGDAGSTKNTGKLTMCDIPYHTMVGGFYAAEINWITMVNGSVVAGQITKFRFTCFNECMKIEAYDGAWRIMLDTSVDNRRTAPICGQNRWSLYPRITMAQNNEDRFDINGVADAYIEIEEYKCRTDMPSEWYGGHNGDLSKGGCWYSNNLGRRGDLPAIPGFSGQASKTTTIDAQSQNNYTDYSAAAYPGAWQNQSVSGGNRLDEFQVGLVMDYNKTTPPADFPVPTAQGGFVTNPTPNINLLLGFNGAFDTAVFTAGATSVEVLASDFGDTPVATTSLFVRVNSTTQTTFNGATAGISKILYQIPQFNQQGDSTGALFFEPGQRTYVKLGNPNQLAINDIRVDIVDRNERYATELNGATIVMFHIVGPKDII